MIKRLTVLLVACVLALTACSAAIQGPSDTSAPRASKDRAGSAPSVCTEVSATALSAVNATITSQGKGNSLPAAVALRDPDSGLWFVAGAFAGPAGEGEGALGIWLTDGDVTSATFSGTIWAVDSGARSWSDAGSGYPSAATYDPENVPALGCWDQIH